MYDVLISVFDDSKNLTTNVTCVTNDTVPKTRVVLQTKVGWDIHLQKQYLL